VVQWLTHGWHVFSNSGLVKWVVDYWYATASLVGIYISVAIAWRARLEAKQGSEDGREGLKAVEDHVAVLAAEVYQPPDLVFGLTPQMLDEVALEVPPLDPSDQLPSVRIPVRVVNKPEAGPAVGLLVNVFIRPQEGSKNLRGWNEVYGNRRVSVDGPAFIRDSPDEPFRLVYSLPANKDLLPGVGCPFKAVLCAPMEATTLAVEYHVDARKFSMQGAVTVHLSAASDSQSVDADQ
jgi:hypothetical protein